MNSPRSVKKTALGGAFLAGALAFLRRKRRALHSSAQEMHDTLIPTGVDEPVGDVGDLGGEGHAAGHRHLSPPPKAVGSTSDGQHGRRYAAGTRSRRSRS